MSWLKELEKYALSAPDTIKPGILLTHTKISLTIKDAYPKAMFHYLVLPRLPTSLGVSQSQLASLRALVSSDKKKAYSVIKSLGEDAETVKSMIQAEMLEKHGAEWPIQIGFHAVPSMEHLHLHVISSDLLSPSLKNKKHYNSFHPSLGFFLHLTDVLEWLADEKLHNKLELRPAKYEELLKADLSCFACDEEFKQIPKLKTHLEQEWKKAIRASAKRGQKRKERENDDDEGGEGHKAKKQMDERISGPNEIPTETFFDK